MHNLAIHTIRKIILLLLYITLSNVFLYGQIAYPGEYSADHDSLISDGCTEISLPAIPEKKSMDGDVASTIPFRYGVSRKLDLNVLYAATQKETSLGIVWQLKIRSTGAKSIGIVFKLFQIPRGAELYIYDEQKLRRYGAYTNMNAAKDGSFTVGDIRGEVLLLEYFEPAGADSTGTIIIDRITHAYLDIFDHLTLKSAAADTNPGINCPEGAAYQDLKHAVCKITFSDEEYTYMCTGTFINNTRNDGTPYFLTAQHCIFDANLAGTVVAYFNYEDTACDAIPFVPLTLSGATLVASITASDFALLLFNTTPPISYDPYYAGWNAYDSAAPTSACIHHPDGEPKKIALAATPAESYSRRILWDDDVYSPVHSHWSVDFEIGYLMEGSSGSALLDPNKRIAGQLHGMSSINSYFGKFSYSWDHESGYTSQLKHWLDPENTGIKLWMTYSPSFVPQADFITPFTKICTEASIVLYDNSLFNPVQWQWQITPSAGVSYTNSTSASSQNPEIIFGNAGMYSVTLIATNSNGSSSITKTNYIEAGSQIEASISGLETDSSICSGNFQNVIFMGKGGSDCEFNLIGDTTLFTRIQVENGINLSLVPSTIPDSSFSVDLSMRTTHGTCSDTVIQSLDILIPFNDDIADAVELVPGSNGFYTNCCAGYTEGEPFPMATGCSTTDGWCYEANVDSLIVTNSIWFKFTGPESGMITLDVKGFDSQIAVYKAENSENILNGTYDFLAANDDRGFSSYDPLLNKIPVDKGARYWVQLDGSKGGSTGVCEVFFYPWNVRIYPGIITDGNVTIEFQGHVDENVSVRIYSLQGRLVLSDRPAAQEGPVKITYNLPYGSKGVLLVAVQYMGRKYAEKIVVL